MSVLGFLKSLIPTTLENVLRRGGLLTQSAGEDWDWGTLLWRRRKLIPINDQWRRVGLEKNTTYMDILVCNVAILNRKPVAQSVKSVK